MMWVDNPNFYPNFDNPFLNLFHPVNVLGLILYATPSDSGFDARLVVCGFCTKVPIVFSVGIIF